VRERERETKRERKIQEKHRERDKEKNTRETKRERERDIIERSEMCLFCIINLSFCYSFANHICQAHKCGTRFCHLLLFLEMIFPTRKMYSRRRKTIKKIN
jgi:hypothetical protein